MRGIGRCARLDSEGHRCKSILTHWATFPGDSELDFEGVCSWVLVVLCDEHDKFKAGDCNASGLIKSKQEKKNEAFRKANRK